MPSRNGISERLPSGQLDFEQVARAVILDGDDRADRLALAIDAWEPDEVGVIIFALFERRQWARSTSTSEPRSASAADAVGNALEPRNGDLPAVAGKEKAALSTAHVDTLMPGEAGCAVGKQLQPNLALHAMRAGHRGECDALCRSSRPVTRPSRCPRRRLRAGSSLETPSASATGCSGVSAPSAGASSTEAFGRLGGDDSATGASSAAASASAGASSVGASALFSGRSSRRRLPQRRLPRHFLGRSLGGLLSGGLFSRSRRRPRRQQLRRRPRASHALRRAPWPSRPARPSSGCCEPARSLMPAASRKRRTRSDGWAPTDSQCEMRSPSSFTRSGESFASSGL